jgi:hypothetical protein
MTERFVKLPMARGKKKDYRQMVLISSNETGYRGSGYS